MESGIQELPIAFLAILNKNNSPFLLCNYMAGVEELELKMLIYQTLDLFDGKQKINKEVANQQKMQQETYLGLITELFVG